MSEVLDDHTALRLATAIRQQFPEWAAERDTIDAPSASERGEYANFILASNWVWSAQGLQELSRELQRRVDVSSLIYPRFGFTLPSPFSNVFIGITHIFRC